jgi:hypothetical protein
MQCSADFEGQLPHRSRFISPVPFGNGLFLLLMGGRRKRGSFGELFPPSGKECLGGLLLRYRSLPAQKDSGAALVLVDPVGLLVEGCPFFG